MMLKIVIEKLGLSTNFKYENYRIMINQFAQDWEENS